MIMHPNQVQATRRLRERQKAKGLKSVTVTVPAERAEELKALAAKWRSNA